MLLSTPWAYELVIWTGFTCVISLLWDSKLLIPRSNPFILSSHSWDYELLIWIWNWSTSITSIPWNGRLLIQRSDQLIFTRLPAESGMDPPVLSSYHVTVSYWSRDQVHSYYHRIQHETIKYRTGSDLPQLCCF